ncbi:MAG: M23 family metallopeptidase [Lachnospiraceae bacterium]|nr:M23 family metallopeptidase [Lachnospiraceae bacterium]
MLAGMLYLCSFCITIYITGYELKLLNTQRIFYDAAKEGINYEALREVRINEEVVKKADHRVEAVLKKYEALRNHPYINRIGYITLAMVISDYNPTALKQLDNYTFLRGIGKLGETQVFQELYGYYDAILSDLTYFPVPRVDSEKEDVRFGNSWYALREYGGRRRHEGTDIMAYNNKRGYFPVISMTDGIVEKLGWLEKGGNRIGIRSKAGGYFYYAHLDSYAPGLCIGDEVIAGELLGFMGDSGYGAEGTIGKFDVHLHVGIYVNSDTRDFSVNPYWILKLLEKNRINYQDLK